MTLDARIRAALTPYMVCSLERFDAAVAAVMRAVLDERGPDVVRMADRPRCAACGWYGGMHAPTCGAARIVVEETRGVSAPSMLAEGFGAPNPFDARGPLRLADPDAD